MDKLKDIQDYLESLAEKHKDLLHNTYNRRAFARFKTDAHITQITKHQTTNIVVIAEVNGQRIGSDDDQEIRRGIAIIFASKASSQGNREEAIDNANEKSEQIMLDFISRMQYDQGQECDFNFDFDTISWNDIEGPWLDSYYGWMLFLPFRGYMPEYDADQWTS